MSQQDRGAYTPQTDAPLAFDARSPRGGRRPLPMALIGSGVVLVALIVAVIMYYRSGVRTAPSGQPPAVGQPVAAVKTAPGAADEAKSEDPFSNLDVYSAQNATAVASAAKPTFAPAPEQPAPRSAADAGLKVQTVEPSTVHAVPAPKPEPAKPAPAPAPAPTQLAVAPGNDASGGQTHLAPLPAAKPAPAKPVAVAEAKPAPAPKPAPAKAEPAKTEVAKSEPAKSEPAAAAGAMVQIGAFSSTALADKDFGAVATAFPGPMAGKGKKVERLERDGKVLFRGLITGFASHASAASFCEELKAAGRSCLVRG